MNFYHPHFTHWDSLQAGSGDPRLADLINGNFNLTKDSPLRGSAINLSEFYEADFNGKELPKSGKWDIGAIQF